MSSSKKKPIQTLTGSSGLIRAREIISGQYDEYRASKFIEPHRRNFYSFFLVKQGNIKHSIDFASYTCSKGQVFFMAPQQVYLVDSAEDFGGISISCQPEMLEKQELDLPIIRNILHSNRICPDNDDFAEILGVAEKMISIFRQDSALSRELMTSYLRIFLLYLSRAWIKDNPMKNSLPGQAAIVEKFRSLINQHWKEFHQVVEYAARLHITPGHLNSLVKASTGKSAIDLIQEKKLTEAKRFLVHSDLSIKEIAFESGFEDPAYFSRFFKKWNKVTPLEFRVQIREKYKSGL